MIFAIHAFENQYGGLHGIENHLIIDVDSVHAAEEIARESSRDVMDSYSNIMESFEEEAESDGLEKDTEEWRDYIEACIQENIAYQIWEVVYPYASLAEMEDDFYNSKDEFIKKHCKEIE